MCSASQRPCSKAIGVGKADPLMDLETDYFKDLRSHAIAGMLRYGHRVRKVLVGLASVSTPQLMSSNTSAISLDY
jgi:hypothetical protein